jgi:hypothetical protein
MTRVRTIKVGGAVAAAFVSFCVFMLSSMAGPHQLDFLLITALCDVVLIVLAAV